MFSAKPARFTSIPLLVSAGVTVILFQAPELMSRHHQRLRHDSVAYKYSPRHRPVAWNQHPDGSCRSCMNSGRLFSSLICGPIRVSPLYAANNCQRPNPLIVGGLQAKDEDFHFMAVIKTFNQFHCGGSLITTKHVLTARHCVVHKELHLSTLIPSSQIEVILGERDRSVYEGYEQDKAVSAVFVHERGNADKPNSYDVAVIELQSHAVLGHYADSKRCLVVGWGATDGDTHQHYPDKLRFAVVPIVGFSECQAAYPGLIDHSMLCAGLPQGGPDSCTGDSGGPLLCMDTRNNLVQVGIVSWGGKHCGAPGYFGVYVRLTSVMPWIRDVAGVPW
ncbi:unnamed protein product [Notodromas monacha]|uniref:Peptidase S1 domain-containing protein n=1 Tax=Notodromas monacha TaxID=399045 RepID=A0A7R9BYE0_9CRUS|nr:unnamed protein product [Notodromas monacha]CAG0922713.1 unnamed protein product [Notodromas monacha]